MKRAFISCLCSTTAAVLLTKSGLVRAVREYIYLNGPAVAVENVFPLITANPGAAHFLTLAGRLSASSVLTLIRCGSEFLSVSVA